MRLLYPTQAEAQAVADRIHADLIFTVPEYAGSVEAGYTLRWDTPRQEIDREGVPVSPVWFVAVDARCMGVLTAGEIAAII